MTQCEASSEERAVAGALLKARSVVVCAHVNPDGDAVGAVLALTLALRATGVEAIPTLADARQAPATYCFLDGFDLYRPSGAVDAPDVFVALDTPTWTRLGDAEALARSSASVVVIDHHADDVCYGALNLVDPDAASTASIVWRLLPALGVTPTPAIANACYVALMTDTGRFSYSNATPRALRDAADMIEAGADAHCLYAKVYESRTGPALALLGRVLSRVTLANDDRVVYSWITDNDLAETGALPEETENLVDIVRQTGSVDAVVIFKEEAGVVKVSLRAKSPTLDVGAIARLFGGGGHVAAAGATIALPLDDAIGAVLRVMPGAAA
jgi:bifunctional oligoribonuclease and PAP phosphatase NrnA